MAGGFALFRDWGLCRAKRHSNGVKMAVFSEKLQELPSGWGLRPQAPIAVNCYLAHNLHNQPLSKSSLQGFLIKQML